MKWWSSRSLGKHKVRTARSLLGTSGEQTLASSGICSAEYHGTKPRREEGPKKLVNIKGSTSPSSGPMHPKKRKSGKNARWPASINKELLD